MKFGDYESRPQRRRRLIEEGLEDLMLEPFHVDLHPGHPLHLVPPENLDERIARHLDPILAQALPQQE